MKIFLTACFALLLCSYGSYSQPLQPNQEIYKKAGIFADSLIRAYEFQNWDTYLSLSYSGAVKYYGGKAGYLQHVQRARKKDEDLIDQPMPTFKIIQLENDIDEWQCVVEKTTSRLLDGKPSMVISYLLGQSLDDGLTWKFFDVSQNAVSNVIYMMPDVFTNLAIPESRIVKL